MHITYFCIFLVCIFCASNKGLCHAIKCNYMNSLKIKLKYNNKEHNKAQEK